MLEIKSKRESPVDEVLQSILSKISIIGIILIIYLIIQIIYE